MDFSRVMQRHLVLIGMMGAGKTTTGKLFAAQQGWPFVDTDQAIVEEEGASIPELFERHGEPWFRERETAALRRCLEAEPPTVIAAGGGIVLAEQNRTMLTGQLTVWLRASESTILARVGGGVGRPLLANDPIGTVRRLLAARESLYRASASATIEIDDLTTPQIIQLLAVLCTTSD